MPCSRRTWLGGAGLGLAALSPLPALAKPFAPLAGPRARLIFCNDLSGDIDGLFAAVHAILSPSLELRAIVGTSTYRSGRMIGDSPPETAANAAAIAREMLALMKMPGRTTVVEGGDRKLSSLSEPVESPGARAIIAEAMRNDTALPLYVAAGGALTEIASAIMFEPKVAERITVVWNGGMPYPNGGLGETNFGFDPLAAQFLFNETAVRIWQVPIDVFATCVVSASEIQAYVAPCGAIGRWLYAKLLNRPDKYRRQLNMGETWTLGDSPLILLTALNDWPPSGQDRPFRYEGTSSSRFDEIWAPRLGSDGSYTPRSEGRKIRVYKSVDSRLMLGDLFAKLRVNFGS